MECAALKVRFVLMEPVCALTVDPPVETPAAQQMRCVMTVGNASALRIVNRLAWVSAAHLASSVGFIMVSMVHAYVLLMMSRLAMELVVQLTRPV